MKKNEVEEYETVMVRFPLKKPVHKDAKRIHAGLPNTMTFADTLAFIIEQGIKSIVENGKGL